MLGKTISHYKIISELGRAEEARRHFEAFRELFIDPDPELLWMLEEAREAIERLEKQS